MGMRMKEGSSWVGFRNRMLWVGRETWGRGIEMFGSGWGN